MKLVLLPGLDGTGELFADFVRSLHGIDCQVVAYPRNRAMNYAEHAAYVRLQLPREEPFVLMGESFSGPVAISLGAENPAGLRGLILCCSFAANPLPVFAPLARLVAVAPGIKLPARVFAPWLYSGEATPELRRAHSSAMASVTAATLKARVTAVLKVDYRDRLKRIAVPLLYLRAQRDRLIPRTALTTLQRARADLQVEEFDAPHFLLQSRPDECAAAVRKFLASLRTHPECGQSSPRQLA